MSSVRNAGIIASAIMIALSVLGGCGEEKAVKVNTTEDLLEAPAPPEPPAEEQAREIVAEVTGVGADDVTIVDQAAAGDLLTINATIPANEEMLPQSAGAPETEPGEKSEQRIEWVKVRWDTAAERPYDITWPERLQFAEEEPVTEEQALETARELKEKWFPEVPAEMVLQPPHRLNRPVWAIAWRGETEDDVLTGDQVAVQVSAVTALPIAYSQRVAVQRPSADEIEITRDEAIGAAREALAAQGAENAEGIPLVARLVLSAPAHPEGGPAWLVRGTGEADLLVIPVDAMTGEVVVPEDGDGRAETSSSTRPDDGNAQDNSPNDST